MTQYPKRVLLKLSGESFKGATENQDITIIKAIASDILEGKKYTQVALVVGGGNICRGGQFVKQGVSRSTADYTGMLATTMNAIVLQDIFKTLGAKAKVFSSLPMGVCETYSRELALEAMSNDYITIFAGGTGNPFVTTDTAAVIKAIEMNCDLLLKGTSVDGVYDSDPRINKNAKKFETISYDHIIKNHLNVMDISSVVIAAEHKLPIAIFPIAGRGEFAKVIKGEGHPTLIK